MWQPCGVTHGGRAARGDVPAEPPGRCWDVLVPLACPPCTAPRWFPSSCCFELGPSRQGWASAGFRAGLSCRLCLLWGYSVFWGVWAQQSTERRGQTRAWGRAGGTGRQPCSFPELPLTYYRKYPLIRGRDSIPIKPLKGRSFLAPVFTFPLPLEVVVGPSLSSSVQ